MRLWESDNEMALSVIMALYGRIVLSAQCGDNVILAFNVIFPSK